MLGWIAIQHSSTESRGSIHLLDLDSRSDVRYDLPGRPGFFAETDRPGVVVIGLERRLALFDLIRAQLRETGVHLPEDESVIINDGIAIEGGLVFGTKHLGFSRPIARLYHFDAAKRELEVLRPDLICSNGKHLYQREGVEYMIDIDSPTRRIEEFRVDFKNHAMTLERVVADLTHLVEVPDGLRATPDGKSVVVAFYHPGDVSDGVARQISIETGEIEVEWRFPGAPRVTCPEFVELEGAVKLVCTTAVEGMPADLRLRAPRSGDLFVAETTFAELPPAPPPFPAGSL